MRKVVTTPTALGSGGVQGTGRGSPTGFRWLGWICSPQIVLILLESTFNVHGRSKNLHISAVVFRTRIFRWLQTDLVLHSIVHLVLWPVAGDRKRGFNRHFASMIRVNLRCPGAFQVHDRGVRMNGWELMGLTGGLNPSARSSMRSHPGPPDALLCNPWRRPEDPSHLFRNKSSVLVRHSQRSLSWLGRIDPPSGVPRKFPLPGIDRRGCCALVFSWHRSSSSDVLVVLACARTSGRLPPHRGGHKTSGPSNLHLFACRGTHARHQCTSSLCHSRVSFRGPRRRRQRGL